MTNLEVFLRNIEDLKMRAKTEIKSRDNRPEVTALRAKYLGKNTGALKKALQYFVATNTNEKQLSKHAVKLATEEINTSVTARIVEITKLEND